MATLKQFEERLKEHGETGALAILAELRAADRATRSARAARRVSARKMTPALAAEILRLDSETEMTQQEIAFALRVNQGRVNEVIKHRKWVSADPSAPEAVARDEALARAAAGVGITPHRRTKRRAGDKGVATPTPAPRPDGRGSSPKPSGAPSQPAAQLAFPGLL